MLSGEKSETFPARTIFALFTLSLGFHLLVQATAFHFNEDIWARNAYNLKNIWTMATVSFASPTYYLLLVATDMFPPWGLFSHTSIMVVLLTSLIFAGMMLRKHWQLSLPKILLALTLFLSSPSITEATVWIAGSHTFISLFWLIALCLSLPTSERATEWRYWLLPTFIAVIFSTSSSFAYIPFALIAVAFFLRWWKHPKVFLVGSTGALFAGAGLLYRNYLLNRDFLNFNNNPAAYNQGGKLELSHFVEHYNQFLELTQPLLLPHRYLPQMFLAFQSYSSPWVLVHLLWLLPATIWVIRRYGQIALVLVLAEVGVALTVLKVDNLTQRYLIVPVFVNAIITAVILSDLVFTSSSRTVSIVGRLLAVLIIAGNLYMKMESELIHWVNSRLIDSHIADIAMEHAEPKPALVFLQTEELAWRLGEHRRYMGGTAPALAGIRRLVLDAGSPACLYTGVTPEAPKNQRDLASYYNSEAHAKNYLLVAKGWACPILPDPQTFPHAFCWRHDFESFPWGKLIPVTGTIDVPVEYLDKTIQVGKVHCIKKEDR